MTTCLDPNICPGDKLYNIVCNFSNGYIYFECNSITCMRADGKYDCCSLNVYDCSYPASLMRIPTIQPTIMISETNCNEKCNKIDKCYWYETLKRDKLCYKNNNEYCCSQNRQECCMTNKTAVYIIFGCIAGILIIFVYYWYYIKKLLNKIAPVEEPVFV